MDQGHDSEMVTELWLFGSNDAAVYRASFAPYARNMTRKWRRGAWDAARAVDGAYYVANEMVKAYHREHGDPRGKWFELASTATRRALAGEIAGYVRRELECGNEWS